MKVVRIVSELDFGGVEQVLANSLPELQKTDGLILTVIVLGRGGRVSALLQALGIEVLVWNKSPRIPKIQLLFKLKAYLKNHQPDIVHTQGGEANFHGILAAHWAGVTNIIGEEIGIPNHHSYWKPIFRWVYKKANKIIAISEAVKANIVELGEVEEMKVEVIFNPIGLNFNSLHHQSRIEQGQNENNENKSFIFITTCRLVPVKNLDRLLIAFSEVLKEATNQKTELWVLGDGPLKVELQALADKLQISNKVYWLGFQEDVQSFLKQSNVFILPSLSEGSSVSLAEAMAVGLPSIVTKVGGTVEILGNSNAGYLIDPLVTQDLKNAMQKMLSLYPEERQALGQRAKEEAKRFSVDNYIKSLLKVYDFKS